MVRALKSGIKAHRIFFLTCDTILDRKDLYYVLKYYLENNVLSGKGRFSPSILFIDEVTYVKDWDLTVKALADEGLLRKVVCCLSASDSILLEDALSRLPGRRGDAERLDFKLHPLLFKDVVDLLTRRDVLRMELEHLFSRYILTGGYISAINDLEQFHEIKPATYRVYRQWVLGDFLRLNRSKKNLLQVLFSIINCYGSQVSFQTLSQHTEGLTKDTVNEYCWLLERLGVISIQHAFDQNKLRSAPKKHKKIHFLDPFIATAMRELVDTEYERVPPINESLLVESTCYAHYLRKYRRIYYIKADGEVDLVIVDGNTFVPVEIKWRKKLRPKDLKQIKKYANGFILAAQDFDSEIGGVRTKSLVKHLFTL